MVNELFFSFMTALLVCMALIPLLRLIAERFQIMDQPGGRKVHEYPVPRIGGIAFAVGACASIAWWGPKDAVTLSVLLGSVIIVAIRGLGRPCRSQLSKQTRRTAAGRRCRCRGRGYLVYHSSFSS